MPGNPTILSVSIASSLSSSPRLPISSVLISRRARLRRIPRRLAVCSLARPALSFPGPERRFLKPLVSLSPFLNR